MARDLTEKQFQAALKRHGFVPEKFLGYVRLPDSCRCVSRLNGGPTRRQQLAYLLEQARKHATTPAEQT